MSRSAAASTSPPTPGAPGHSAACATSGRSPPCACIPPIPTSCTSPRSAIRSPITPSAASTAPPTAARTWKQVLFVSDSAGAADLEIQPGTPNVLFACMWHGQRKPWTIISGAREGGIYKSTDGGDTWTKLGGGLPNELFGRSNVAISAAMPEPHLRADRGQAGQRPVPLRGRGRHLDADQRRGQPHHAAVLLHHAGRRSERPRPALHRRRGLVQERGRRQDASAPRPRRMATITISGSIRATRSS